jgi:hypothetical protein
MPIRAQPPARHFRIRQAQAVFVDVATAGNHFHASAEAREIRSEVIHFREDDYRQQQPAVVEGTGEIHEESGTAAERHAQREGDERRGGRIHEAAC